MVQYSHMKRGFIALITVITASAVALIIGSSILLKSITESNLSADEEFSNKAWATVNACAEHALYNLASTTNSGGSEWYNHASTTGYSIDIDGNTCYIYPIVGTEAGTTSPRLIQASSTVRDFTRKLSIIAATNTPSVTVDSWTEVADF